MDSERVGTVFYRRGPVEVPCFFTFSKVGIEAWGTREPGGHGPLWARTVRWVRAQELDIGSGPDGATLRADDQLFRFPNLTELQLLSLVVPYLPRVGAAFGELDCHFPVVLADMTFESVDLGGQIWYAEWITEDHRDLVDRSAEWLLDQPGVMEVRLEAYQSIHVHGRFDEELRDALGGWWTDRVPGFDPGDGGPVQPGY